MASTEEDHDLQSPGLERISVGEELQIIDQGPELLRQVRLHKERYLLPGSPPLSLVRKHLPGGPLLPPVLLVHGFAQNRYSWHTSRRSMSAWLAERGFDVWTLELRGHGLSRQASGPERPVGAERFGD